MPATIFSQTISDQNMIVNTAANDAIIQLLPSAGMPCRAFTYGKNSSDANTVTIQPAGSDTIGGVPNLILTSIGTVTIKPVTGGWIIVAQPPTTGGGSSVPAAPNVTGPGTVTVNYPVYGTVQHWQLGIPIVLPSSGLANLAYLMAYLNGTIIGGPYNALNVTGWAAGASVTLNSVDLGPNAATNTSEPGVEIVAYNSADVATASPYTTGTFTVHGYGPTGTGVTVGAEIPNPTLTSVAIEYGTSADGIEQWQAEYTATPPSDPRFQCGRGICSPTAVLQANTAAGAANSALQVYVEPWYPSGVTCDVDSTGLNVTNISSPVAPAIAGNWAQIGGTVVQVATWISATAVTLASAVSPGTGVTYKGCEFRYGGFTPGDTVQIGNQKFTFVGPYGGSTYPVVGSLDSSGRSSWVLNSNGAPVQAQTAGTLVWDISQPPTDIYDGYLYAGEAGCAGDPCNIGAPAAYTFFMPSQDAQGTFNTWPVSGVTPQYGPLGVETQTPGSIDGNRLAASTVGSPTSGTTTPSKNMLTNGTFDFPLATGWDIECNTGYYPTIPQLVGPSVVQPMSGVQSVQFTAGSGGSGHYQDINTNGNSGNNLISIKAGKTYQAVCEVQAMTSGTTGTITLKVRLLDNLGGYTDTDVVANVGGTSGDQAAPSGQWTSLVATVTAPSGTHTTGSTSGLYVTQAAIYVRVDNCTSGGWWVDSVELFEVLQSGRTGINTGALSFDSNGNLQLTPASLNIGYFTAGQSLVYFGTSLPSLPNSSYPNGTWFFDTSAGGGSGRAYYNKTGAWVDKGDPGDMIAGTIAAGVAYIGAIATSQLTAGGILDCTFQTNLNGVTFNIDNNSYSIPGGGSGRGRRMLNNSPGKSGVYEIINTGTDDVSYALIDSNGNAVVVLSSETGGGGTVTVYNSSGSLIFQVDNIGNINALGLPTSSSGLPTGYLWVDPSAGNAVKRA